MRSVEEGLGGGRCAVQCRHEQKGGRRDCDWSGGHGRWLLLQWRSHCGRVGLRDAESLGEGSQGAGRGIAESAERREEGGEEDVNPLIGFALPHAEQASLNNLECVGLHIGENKGV